MAKRTYTCGECNEEFRFPPNEFQCRLSNIFTAAISLPHQEAVDEAMALGGGTSAQIMVGTKYLDAERLWDEDALGLSNRFERAMALGAAAAEGSLTAEQAWAKAGEKS